MVEPLNFVVAVVPTLDELPEILRPELVVRLLTLVLVQVGVDDLGIEALELASALQVLFIQVQNIGI